MAAILRFVILVFALYLPAASLAEDAGIDADAGAQSPEPQGAPEVPADRMPELTLEVKPTEASVGEVIYWRLGIKRRAEDRVHLSGSASFGALEIRAKEINPGKTQGDWVEEVLEVQLIGFEPSEVTIPSQKLTVVDFEGRMATLKTEESHVVVKSLVANEPEPALKEDQGPGEKVLEKDYLLLWILAVLIGVGLIVLLTLLGRWLWAKRRPKPEPPPPPPRPAEEIAYEKLEALRGSDLLAEGLVKEFHVRLSETIREYLGNRYRFDSLELSSEELISALRKISMSKAELDLVLDFLSETDLVKFAKVIPSLEESRGLLDQSFEFVKRTTPAASLSANEGSKEQAATENQENDHA
jgi:hypothetical protein